MPRPRPPPPSASRAAGDAGNLDLASSAPSACASPQQYTACPNNRTWGAHLWLSKRDAREATRSADMEKPDAHWAPDCLRAGTRHILAGNRPQPIYQRPGGAIRGDGRALGRLRQNLRGLDSDCLGVGDGRDLGQVDPRLDEDLAELL